MTAIDITDPDTIRLSQACRELPPGRNNSRPHLSTLLRWILTGATAPDGRRVKLAAVRLGGKWLTSRVALAEFAAALTPSTDDQATPSPRTPVQRRRASERAARGLESVGI